MITLRLTRGNYEYHLWWLGLAWQLGEYDRHQRALSSTIAWGTPLP